MGLRRFVTDPVIDRPSLLVSVPAGFAAEREWIVSNLMGTVGCAYEIRQHEHAHWQIRITGPADDTARAAILEMPDAFFPGAEKGWLQSSSMPKLPVPVWQCAGELRAARLTAESVPVLFGRPGFRLETPDRAHLGLDIFGAAFFMLARYEEYVSGERDGHDRFPATASVATAAGFLRRPLVDEYAEILRAALDVLRPGQFPHFTAARTIVSCDVDCPYEQYVVSAPMLARKLGRDALRDKAPAQVLRTLGNAIASRFGTYDYDPANTFDWIMDANEKRGNAVAFYFVSQSSNPTWDVYYRLDEPRMRALLRRIHERGHEIGLHASYDSCLQPGRLASEMQALKSLLAEERIGQEKVGVRLHYLRWRIPETLKALADTQPAYDTSLGFADAVGFRCGSCRPYQLFDILGRRPTGIEERPLIAMETSLFAEAYMGCAANDASREQLAALKAATRRVGGDFRLLWHNDSLREQAQREIYLSLLD